MSDNDRCELGLALQVVERLQIDPYQAIANHFEVDIADIDLYVDEINNDDIIFRIAVDDVSTIESIVDIIRGYNWNTEKVLCSTLNVFNVNNISIDICTSNNISSFVVAVDTKKYFQAIS
tara:strand:- start:10524 stop:10883 length:360 start_codon:yes stop_codon:yes gene_type:complete